MVYFQINRIGFNCGYSKNKCPKNARSCSLCIKNKLKELGFEIDSNLEIFELDSEEKRLKLKRDIIWQRFLDVLNIKTIIIMDKESGLTLLNYDVSGVDIDANLLSGFIQANITFSESSKVSIYKVKSTFEYYFYEFQYKNFNILLKDGKYIRVCLILDHKASDEMRNNVFRFLGQFEDHFKEEFVNFQSSGSINLKDMVENIIKSFYIDLVFPMTLAHSIPPLELEKINKNLIQKAIINLAKELISTKPFFFVNNMLNRLKKIVHIEPNIVLYEIYQLLEKKIIVPTSIETIVNRIETLQEANHERITKIKSISSIIIDDSDIDDLKENLENIDDDTAKKMIREFMKKGKTAEKESLYQATNKEYNKALFIAKEFNLKEDITKISQKIFDLESKSKQIELNYNIKMAENAEKNGDFINSINYYQKALKIFESFLVYNIVDPRIKKFKKKILKLREEI